MFFWLHMVEGWQPVHVSISVAALLFPATFGESVGSQWGISREQLRTCFAGGVVATSFHTQCAPLLRQVLALLIRF